MLHVAGLTRRSAAGDPLIEDVSFELAEGDRLALVGPSGAGKSVLLRALALLDPIQAGTVAWRGREPHGDAVPPFRRRVHYLQQRPFVTDARVDEQLALPWSLESAGGEPFDHSRAAELLAQAGRGDDFLTRRGTNLSGGESQLVALARALLLDSRVLLLDEPTSAMDGDTRAAAERLLGDWISRDPRRAWIWVSHDDRQLERTCDRTLRISGGRLAQ